MAHYQYLRALIAIILIETFQVTAWPTKSTHDQVRVLVINDTQAQTVLEEAASLSLDLPISDPTNKPQRTSSLLQNSLSSLTLSQRGPRAAEQLKFTTTPVVASATTSKEPLRNTIHDQRDKQQWKELLLPRLKPTWLNVSQQFKITPSSIEEIDYMMPAEYFLRTAFDSPILLKTRLGILEGVRSIKFNKHLYTFLSIPYAKPPTDELRFKLPQPVGKWNGIYQATKWPPFCVQPSMTLATRSSPVHVLTQMMSEDCLYLNIWTPSLKLKTNNKRPVMVWLHGGAFQYGGISVDENDGSALALMGDVVVVTLNYRVSAFGFLNANNQFNGPNNVGLFDQRLAMEWVQANIEQFGGDPQQVTLFGESAGGHSVGLHMISPQSYPLFKRAILQSGVPISYLRSYDVNADNTGSAMSEGVSSIMMAKRLKCFKDVAEPESLSTPATTEAPTPTTTILTNIFTNETVMAIERDNSTESLDDIEVDNFANLPILSDATLDCMRNKSSLDILKAMGTPGNAGFFPTGNDPNGFFPNGPIVSSFDSDNLKVGPQKDYLIGTNTDEGTFMLHYGLPNVFPSKKPPTVNNIEDLKDAMLSEINRSKNMSLNLGHGAAQESLDSASGKSGGGAQAHLYKPLLKTSSSILESFMPKSHVRVLENGTIVGNTTIYSREAEFGKHVGSLITDIIFLCPARSLARTLSEAGRNVYFYLYTHRNSLTPYHDWIGVTHHDEVEFVFGRPLRMADVHSGKDIEMSQRMIKVWSHFARTGQMLAQFNLDWPKYGEEDGNYMTLNPTEAFVGQRYHDKICNIYDTVISVHLQAT